MTSKTPANAPKAAPASTQTQATFRSALLTALMALVFGFLGAAIWSISGIGDAWADNRTRAFLMDNPEVLPEMAQELQARDSAKRLAAAGDEVFDPFPGAVLGNPDGSRTLVEFTDYNCPYCEASLRDVNQLVTEDPDLRVIVREYPIFEGSDVASRMALAAAMQGKYDAFHTKMFELGPANPETVEAAGIAAGLDMQRARIDAESNPVSLELARNQALARAIGFGGTPAWVSGDRAVEGAVGYESLKDLIEQAGPQAES